MAARPRAQSRSFSRFQQSGSREAERLDADAKLATKMSKRRWSVGSAQGATGSSGHTSPDAPASTFGSFKARSHGASRRNSEDGSFARPKSRDGGGGGGGGNGRRNSFAGGIVGQMASLAVGVVLRATGRRSSLDGVADTMLVDDEADEGDAAYADEAHAPATLIDVDTAAAGLAPGVVRVFDKRDMPEGSVNELGPIAHDEECFADGAVYHVGQVRGP